MRRLSCVTPPSISDLEDFLKEEKPAAARCASKGAQHFLQGTSARIDGKSPASEPQKTSVPLDASNLATPDDVEII